MSFFPIGFDPRSDVVGYLNLVNINTPDGDFGFMIGTDGVFTDTTGKRWWGSTLFNDQGFEFAINGSAPSGSIDLRFFQDPEAGALVDQIKALGVGYIEGREIRFYQQPLFSVNDLYAPAVPPSLEATRYMTAIGISFIGALERKISLSFETDNIDRNSASMLRYTTVDHGKLIGSANPSLSLMPSDTYQEEPLFA